MKELTISSDAPGERLFMLGNEAIARGAIEAGVQVTAAYPGTPSSEIMGALSEVVKDIDMYIEWSINEKVAFEVSLGVSICGLRGLSCMKHVGVNVAHDSLMTAGYWGAIGGLVLLAADDPEQWSSQNEQDTRYIGEQGYFPILEPSTPQEAKDMMVDAFKLSEEFRQPFIVRTVMRVGHARSDVVLGEISKEKRQGFFPKGAAVFYAHRGPESNRQLMIERFKTIKKAVNTFPYNQLRLANGAKLGIIACGVSYNYALEAIRELELEDKVSVLKIGTTYPLPEELVKSLLDSVGEILVIEELEPFVEIHVKAIAGEGNIPVKIHGKDLLPLRGELSPRPVIEAIAKLTGTKPLVNFAELDRLSQEVAPLLPFRPPVLCAGCPHRASFYAITTASKRVAKEYGEDVQPIYPGDIGCYVMGRVAPLNAVDTMVAMGGSIGISCGLFRSVKAPIIAHLGDSTFFHAGIPPLINAVYNKVNITVVVLDNRATAMTGFQPHPGTGFTAMGEETVALNIEDVAKGCGVQFVEVMDPLEDLKKAADIIEKAIRFDGPSVVVFRRICTTLELREKTRRGEEIIPYYVDQEKCSKCDSGLTKNRLFPCKAACPAGNDIKDCLDLVKQGKFEEGLDLIKKNNPLPAVLGRVCYHPCEGDCNRGHFDEAIAIHNIERFLGDYGLTLPSKKEPVVKREEKVAIIGSGPAGLSCAYHLTTMGYGVTIFEALSVPGGMLAVGIPEYRLPKEVLRAEIKAIEDLGVEIRTNTPIDRTDHLLEQGYRAVFVAVGAHKSMKLGVPDEDKDGVFPALNFLREVNLGNRIGIGDKVVIVGGGNVAMDAARVALRQGAKQVSIIYRRTRAEMPASDEEIVTVEEEGVSITYLAAPTKVLTEGKVTGLECIRMKLGEPDETGRARPIPIEGSQFTIDADTVISAIGQTPDLSFTNHELEIASRGTLTVDTNTLATNKPGIFAGGDAVTGPATVAEAIGAGKRASLSIDRYIRGVPLGVTEEQPPLVKFEDLNLTFARPVPRAAVDKLPVADRVKGFAEVDGSFDREVAIAEALRCLACSVGAEMCITHLGCPAVIRENGNTIIDELQCSGCGICAQVCPYKAIVQEQRK